MTPAQAATFAALRRCRFCPGSWDKRFVRDVSSQTADLTAKQAEQLERLAHAYRRQLGKCLATKPCARCGTAAGEQGGLFG